jgi:sulfoacetaldehyde dehydrogenase
MAKQSIAAASDSGAEVQTVAELMARARAAMKLFANATQERVDEAVTALAWALYSPEHAHELAASGVRDTGLGNVPDKVTKNQRKTFGTLRDLLCVKTVGVIEEDRACGIVKYAKPVGVVGAITPSTNPAATPVNKAMMALKGRNAIVIAPSPAGWSTTARVVELMRAELEKIGLPADLVQVLPAPVNKALTQALMRACDLIVATGSQNNVRLQEVRQCHVLFVGKLAGDIGRCLRQGNCGVAGSWRLSGRRQGETGDTAGAMGRRPTQP